MNPKQRSNDFIGVRVPKSMKESIIEVVEHGNYLNEFEFVQEVLREKLCKIKEVK